MQMQTWTGNYRAVSWWLTWEDLKWPDADIALKFNRRAEAAAKAGVNCAVIFGTHLRWDFLPLWINLHDMLAFIARALHQRGIMLFDHHSAVLTHRYSSIEEAEAMRLYNCHHVPFAPSRDIASEWTYKGKKLNDWRMIDLGTGEPVFLKQYTAEQFCINNPDFQAAYYDYAGRLIKETGIDGLMSDDGIFYSGWTSCGCKWCRNKFETRYGHTLPPTTDLSFWGNYKNEAFKDWIEMRFASTREFLEGVRNAVGRGFPLMTCCSNSVEHTLAGFAMTYQEFIKPCNHIMLEMCGNTPSLEGLWSARFPAQMLHLGIGKENRAPCLGLGYGFTEAAADFIWAFNKFLGSGMWFSTLKGRLGLPASKIMALKDDTELVGNGYNYERTHYALFKAETSARAAVFYSRWSRDFYSMTASDYVNDYKAVCAELLANNLTFDVVTGIPGTNKYEALIMNSACCLDEGEYSALNTFLENGGSVLATGPLGTYDKRGNPPVTPWLKQFDIDCGINEPERAPSFPPCNLQTDIVPLCAGSYKGRKISPTEWIDIKPRNGGRLLWSPGRMQSHSQELGLTRKIRSIISETITFPDACGWIFRIFEKDNTILIHALAETFNVELMEDLEKQRKTYRGNNLIKAITRKSSIAAKISLTLKETPLYAECHIPLKNDSRDITPKSTDICLNIADDVYYFIVRLVFTKPPSEIMSKHKHRPPHTDNDLKKNKDSFNKKQGKDLWTSKL